MDSPSWTDAFQSAFGSCLHCFSAPSNGSDTESAHNNHPNNINSRRPPHHLEALLAEPQDTDTEAETVSLHSNIGGGGGGQRKRRKNKSKSNITLFGFNLFGTRPPPIHLPSDDEDVDELLGRSSQSQSRQRTRRTRRQPSLTFDNVSEVSDAAPLDSAAIPERVVEESEARAAKEREKEERKRKRRERKEMKKLAQLMHTHQGVEGDFEGFQGSGDNIVDPGAGSYPHIPSPFIHTQAQFAAQVPSPHQVQFGEFGSLHGAGAQTIDDVEDDSADLDGGLYAGPRRPPGGTSSGGSRSDSRRSPGGTSASCSDYSASRPLVLGPGELGNGNGNGIGGGIGIGAQPLASPKPKKSKKSKSSNSSSSTTTSKSKSRSSASAASATSSEPLASPGPLSPSSQPSAVYTEPDRASASPIGSGFPHQAPHFEGEFRKSTKLTLDFEGSGFPSPGFGLGEDRDRDRSFPSPVLGLGLGSGFPSPGLGSGGGGFGSGVGLGAGSGSGALGAGGFGPGPRRNTTQARSGAFLASRD